MVQQSSKPHSVFAHSLYSFIGQLSEIHIIKTSRVVAQTFPRASHIFGEFGKEKLSKRGEDEDQVGGSDVKQKVSSSSVNLVPNRPALILKAWKRLKICWSALK